MRVKVSKATKREFKQNKEYYQEQGIRSSIALQRQKNLLTTIKRKQRATERSAIKAAYERDADYLQELGYTVKDFIELYNYIQNFNERIEKSKKTKYISPTTATFNFPINKIFKKIELKRLSKVINKIKSTNIRKIARVQRQIFYNNIGKVYGPEVEQYARQMLGSVPYGRIVEVFLEYDIIDYLVMYDITAFDDDAMDFHWTPLKDKLGDVYDAILDCVGGDLYS